MLSEFPKIKLFAVIAERSKPAWRSSSTRVLTMPRDAAVTAEMGGPFCSTTKLVTKLIFLLVQGKNNKVEKHSNNRLAQVQQPPPCLPNEGKRIKIGGPIHSVTAWRSPTYELASQEMRTVARVRGELVWRG